MSRFPNRDPAPALTPTPGRRATPDAATGFSSVPDDRPLVAIDAPPQRAAALPDLPAFGGPVRFRDSITVTFRDSVALSSPTFLNLIRNRPGAYIIEITAFGDESNLINSPSIALRILPNVPSTLDQFMSGVAVLPAANAADVHPGAIVIPKFGAVLSIRPNRRLPEVAGSIILGAQSLLGTSTIFAGTVTIGLP